MKKISIGFFADDIWGEKSPMATTYYKNKPFFINKIHNIFIKCHKKKIKPGTIVRPDPRKRFIVVKTKNECVKILEGHHGAVNSIKISADSSMIFSGYQDNSIRIWDAQTGKELMTLEGHDD